MSQRRNTVRSRSRLRNRGEMTRRAGAPSHGGGKRATLSNRRGRKLQRRKRITVTRRSLW